MEGCRHAFPLLQAALVGALRQPQVPSHIPGRRRGCAMHQTSPHIAAYVCTCKEGSSFSVKPPLTSQGFSLMGGLKAANATRMPSVHFDRADFQRWGQQVPASENPSSSTCLQRIWAMALSTQERNVAFPSQCLWRWAGLNALNFPALWSQEAFLCVLFPGLADHLWSLNSPCCLHWENNKKKKKKDSVDQRALKMEGPKTSCSDNSPCAAL